VNAICRPVPSGVAYVAESLQLQTQLIDRLTLVATRKRSVIQWAINVGHRPALEIRIGLHGVGTELSEQSGIDLARGRIDTQAAFVTLHRLFRSLAEVAVQGDIP